MEDILIVSVVILCVTCFILLFRLCSIKRALKELSRDTKRVLESDTNTLPAVYCRDADVMRLCSVIGKAIGDIRKRELTIKNDNTEIGSAITNISHDLRTPLTSVRGYLDLLNRSDDIAEIKRYAGIISERTDTMQALTEQLFRSTVILAGDEVNLKPVNVNNILVEAIASAYTLIDGCGIIPQIDITDKTIIRKLDEECLKRIFSNILSNAAKYSDGDLIIRLDDDGKVSFSNRACSLDEIKVSRLFDRFYTVSDAGGSTGLGLSIAKHLTKLMKGTINGEYCGEMLTISVFFP